MKNILLIISVFILGIVAFSCTDSKTKETLAVSEEIIMDKPDSALSLLEGIDHNKLRGSKDKALYGLLYTMALDKNHLEIKNDSLIDYSVDYFKKKSDKEKLAIALYYQGRVKYMNGNHPLALVTYMQAIDAAEEIDDRFYIGMACRGISDIYSESFNAGDELTYAKREYENIKASGRQPYINYAMLDLMVAYQSNGEYEKVFTMSKALEDSALTSNDLYLYADTQRLSAKAYIGDNKFQEAIVIYNSLCKEGLATNEDSLNLAVSYALSGDKENAGHYLENTATNDSILYAYSHTHVRKIQGRIDEAFYHFENLDRLVNDTLQNKIVKGLSSSVSDSYQFMTKKNREDLKRSRILLALAIMTGVLIAIVTSWVSISVIRKQRAKISEKVIFAERLQELLKQSKEENNTATVTIKDLVSSKYELLEELCEIVLTNSDSRSARKKIADAVTNLIKELSLNGTKIQELGKQVDDTYDNLYSDFRKALPGLKEADYYLFIFSTLGFSNSAISLFLKEEKINAVYDRKRRLKDKIKKLDDDEAQRFLKYI